MGACGTRLTWSISFTDAVMDLRNGKDGCYIPNQRFIPDSGDAATQQGLFEKVGVSARDGRVAAEKRRASKERDPEWTGPIGTNRTNSDANKFIFFLFPHRKMTWRERRVSHAPALTFLDGRDAPGRHATAAAESSTDGARKR